jgi:carotenoid cleavage dioxygenase-like enzyme
MTDTTAETRAKTTAEITAESTVETGWISANAGPVPDEMTATDLVVRGALPPELSGRYLRNGPNPPSGTAAHWFLGDGMIHGVELSGGRATGYRNRWVRTKQLDGTGEYVDALGHVDLSVGAANTSVVAHAGRIMALVESSWPTEITAELDTVGPWDFDGRLTTAMTAHPKIDPGTGEMHFYGGGFFPPYLTYHCADATGTLVSSRVIDTPAPAMIHDFAMTEHHVLFMDLPVVFDLELAMTGALPYRWSDSHGARLGVLAKGDPEAQPTWYEVEPCFVFHTLNAFEEDGRIVLEGCRYAELWRDGPGGFTPTTLHRWTIDPVAGRAAEETVSDRPVEFPRVADDRVGRRHRFGYLVQGADDEAHGPEGTVLARHDRDTDTVVTHDFGPGTSVGEGIFVAAEGGTTDEDGWVLSYVFDAARGTSDLVVLDASDLAGPEVAAVELPRRVPAGFHGTWIPDRP